MKPAYISHPVRNTFWSAVGILSAAFGLKGFIIPNMLIDGGATGVSLLVNQLSGVPLPLLILGINIPFIGLGYVQLGRWFAIKTTLTIVGLAVALARIPFPIVTHDLVLSAIFGGFFLGIGMGLCIRSGAAIDGTDVLALAISRQTRLPVGDIILGINATIFLAATILLNIETALYSLLAYFAATKTVDFVVEGIEEYTGVTIISEKSDAIRRAIIHRIKRGVTLYKGKRGFGSQGERTDDIDVVFTVLTRLELSRLRAEIERIDPSAFVVMHPVSDAKGGMVKRRPYHT